MADFRFFADLADGTTLMSKRCDYDQGERKLPRFWDDASRSWVRATRIVIRKSNPSRHDCDARCYNATGRTMQCECQCGGKNHGKGAFNCTAVAA
jgi:hypothetical protein